MRTLLFLLLPVLAQANALFTSASATIPNGCPAGGSSDGYVTGTDIASASAACPLAGASGTVTATAQSGSLSVEASGTESGIYPFSVVGEAKYNGTAPVGLDVFTFAFNGSLADDGGGPEVIFTISTAGGQDSTTFHVLGVHFISVNETFVSIPLLVTDGNYTADLIGSVVPHHDQSGVGIVDITATLVGIQTVPEPSTIPEPSTMLLTGTVIVFGLLYRKHKRGDSTRALYLPIVR